MKPYLILDVITLVLVALGIAAFYNDLAHGNFSVIITLYFVIIAVAYFIVINMINNWVKKLFRKVAEKLQCEFLDSGKYSLTHYIRCENMEIKINLRGSYTPASLYLKFYGNFKEADIKGSDKNSRRFISNILDLQRKYRIKVNDAYSSKDVAEMIITKFPYNADILEKIILDANKIIPKV